MKKYASRLLTGAVVLASLACGKSDTLGRNDPSQPDSARAMGIELVSASNIGLEFNSAAVLKVRVVYIDDGSPVPNMPVTFRLNGSAGGSALEALELNSASDGLVINGLRSGADKARFSVDVAAGDGDGATIEVVVDGTYDGALRVRFQYDNVIALRDISVGLHEGTVTCDNINYEELPTPLESAVANGLGGSVIFGDLPEDTVYTVTAVAMGRTGTEVAFGCIRTPAIRGRGTVDAVVALTGRPEILTGEFDFGTRLHTDQALPGKVGAVISELNAFFMDPAGKFGAEIVELAATQLGQDPALIRAGLQATWTFLSFMEGVPVDADKDGDFLDDMIKYYLLDKMPVEAQNGLLAGGDLTDLIKNLTVGGRLQIKTVDEDGNVNGHWQWGDFLFMWRWGQDCDYNNTCCGHHRYEGADMGLGPVGGDFVGTLIPGDTPGIIDYDLNVAPHKIGVQIGTLLLFAIENIVLPPVTGENSLDGAIESLFGCDPPVTEGAEPVCGCERAGKWIDDKILKGSFPGVGEVLCDSAVLALNDYVEGLINSLRYYGSESSYFMMEIDGVLADADRDLQMDQILGSSPGTLYINGGAATFGGEITADIVRAACTADSGCTVYEACQARPDVLDMCVGRLSCGPRIGDRVAGQSCTANTNCASGVCLMDKKLCWTACTEDANCPSNLTCGELAATVPVTSGVTMTVNACGL